MIKKIICPRCFGNGYIRIPNKAVGFNEQVIAQCTMCDSQGETKKDIKKHAYEKLKGINETKKSKPNE